jgi:hypothetical protein
MVKIDSTRPREKATNVCGCIDLDIPNVVGVASDDELDLSHLIVDLLSHDLEASHRSQKIPCLDSVSMRALSG